MSISNVIYNFQLCRWEEFAAPTIVNVENFALATTKDMILLSFMPKHFFSEYASKFLTVGWVYQ